LLQVEKRAEEHLRRQPTKTTFHNITSNMDLI
jgi:hypothetical protein